MTFIETLNGEGTSLSTEFQYSKSLDYTKNPLIIL